MELLVANGKGKLTYYTPGTKLSIDKFLGKESRIILDKSSSIPDKNTNIPDKSNGIPDKNTNIPDKSSSIPDKNTNIPDKSSSIPDKNTNIPDKLKAYSKESEELKILKGLPQNIQEQIISIGKRSNDREEVEKLILEICKIRPFTSKELSTLLERHIKHLHSSYLKPLLIKGELKYTIPDMPKHPDQAYKTSIN